MSITLKQLYDQTHIKYQLTILTGTRHLSHTVSRIYYIDDINIAGWTRQGELIMTMGSDHGDAHWLRDLITEILPHEPSGIVVNTGGYIHAISQDIIDLCEANNLPLLTFPWDVFQQDVIQDWTNRIFQADQLESGLSSALLNAIFEPENRTGYMPYLLQHQYKDTDPLVVSVLQISEPNRHNSYKYKTPVVNLHAVFSAFLAGLTDAVSCILLDDRMLMVFFRSDTVYVENLLHEHKEQIYNIFGTTGFRIGVGNAVHSFDKLCVSYNQALLCIHYSSLSSPSDMLSSISTLGVAGLLITCDTDSIKQFYESRLKQLKDYDIANKTEYFTTLKSFLMHHCSINDTAANLFIHRNTVNYRINRIQEFLQIRFDNSPTITEYTIAFMIYDILSVNVHA